MDSMELESLDRSHFMATQKLPFGLQLLLSLLASHHNCTLLDHLYLQKYILISQLQRRGYPTEVQSTRILFRQTQYQYCSIFMKPKS